MNPSIRALHSTAVQQRSVVIVIPDADLRQRLSDRLMSLRWRVLSAAGGAEAMVHLDEGAPEAMIVDHWLPDLDATEFTEHAAEMCPGTDLLQTDGSSMRPGSKSTRRHELLHALREAQEEASVPTATVVSVAAPRAMSIRTAPAKTDGAAWLAAPVVVPTTIVPLLPFPIPHDVYLSNDPAATPEVRFHLPEMVGDAPLMRELAGLVRMVAPYDTSVLIQGETGTGKELVAKAVHRLSARAGKPLVVLNCAAIPEQLLEAELFGHTRGAFTGAVTSRIGRIEAAHGGTLFLDEIGEMPLQLQAKLLRFLESGEIQRVGDNDISRVDVRIVSATHEPLEQNADRKLFRLDLYHRLAVFPVDVPALRDRPEDIPMLVEHFLARFGMSAPRRSISREALASLYDHPWYGNVRELSHMLQRAAILAGDGSSIQPQHLRLKSSARAA
jgi:DNA-binding NtrC family response regulator